MKVSVRIHILDRRLWAKPDPRSLLDRSYEARSRQWTSFPRRQIDWKLMHVSAKCNRKMAKPPKRPAEKKGCPQIVCRDCLPWLSAVSVSMREECLITGSLPNITSNTKLTCRRTPSLKRGLLRPTQTRRHYGEKKGCGLCATGSLSDTTSRIYSPSLLS